MIVPVPRYSLHTVLCVLRVYLLVVGTAKTYRELMPLHALRFEEESSSDDQADELELSLQEQAHDAQITAHQHHVSK